MDKEAKYRQVVRDIEALIDGEDDCIALMSTVVCELYHAFDYFNWVGFYRRVDPSTLKVGPYQGTHGCITIDVGRGVCGACVRTAEIQIRNDVSLDPAHIACSCETRAEIVVPLSDPAGEVIAVLDIDSPLADVFGEIDAKYLENICTTVQNLITDPLSKRSGRRNETRSDRNHI